MLFMKHWIATLLVRWINDTRARILESSVALRESTGLYMTEKIAIRKGSLIEDSEEAAYWIGMLMADGTIGQKHRNGLYPMVKLKLKADDWEYVASLTRYLGLPPERCRVKKRKLWFSLTMRRSLAISPAWEFPPKNLYSLNSS